MTADTTHLAAHIDHLSALRVGLSNERMRLAKAEPGGASFAIRTVWVAKREKETADHIAFLAKLGYVEAAEAEMSDDELLAALLA